MKGEKWIQVKCVKQRLMTLWNDCGTMMDHNGGFILLCSEEENKVRILFLL